MADQNKNLTSEEAEALEAQSSPDNMVFLTGDKHGDMGEVKKFCKRMELPQDSTVIILGDAGVNFFRDLRDKQRKDCLSRLAPTIFCVHGNHEARPTEALGYHEAYYHGGKVMVQDAYPNILFPLDGEIFHFCGQSVLVIGGAYSVDKKLRLANVKMETTPFRKAVWEIMLTIPYGQTMTYGEIADRIAGQRGIARMSPQAVGGAVGHNSISLIIPCHRVVGTDGSLTGYAG